MNKMHAHFCWMHLHGAYLVVFQVSYKKKIYTHYKTEELENQLIEQEQKRMNKPSTRIPKYNFWQPCDLSIAVQTQGQSSEQRLKILDREIERITSLLTGLDHNIPILQQTRKDTFPLLEQDLRDMMRFLEVLMKQKKELTVESVLDRTIAKLSRVANNSGTQDAWMQQRLNQYANRLVDDIMSQYDT
jgi:hypothetical protein